MIGLTRSNLISQEDISKDMERPAACYILQTPVGLVLSIGTHSFQKSHIWQLKELFLLTWTKLAFPQGHFPVSWEQGGLG